MLDGPNKKHDHKLLGGHIPAMFGHVSGPNLAEY